MGSISAYDTRNYAQFNPLSMQEVLQPAMMMREQHDKLQEEYSAQEQAGGLSLLGLKEGIDDEAIKIHQNYMSETKKAADELATKGFIESGRRKNLYGLKQQYNSNVVPLQNQLKIRQERAEELRKIQLQDPTFRATANPNEIGLTAGLKNPEAFNYTGVSGNQLYTSAAKKLEQLSKVIDQEIPELKKMPGMSFQYFTALQSGANPAQVAAAMKQKGFDPTTVDKMTNMIHSTIDTTMQEHGVYDKFKNNPQVIDELWNTTSQAAFNALGQRQFGNVTDQAGMHLWQRNLAQKDEQDRLSQANKQNILEDPEIVNDELYQKHSSVIDYINSGKYKSSKRKGGFDYDAEIKKINDSNIPQWRKDAALKGIAQARMHDTGVDNTMDKKIEALSRKYKTTNLKEIAAFEQQELEKTKQLISVRYYNDDDNSASKQIIENLKFSTDKKDKEFIENLPKTKNGDIDYSSIRTGISPIKGYVVEAIDKNGKVLQNKIHSSKTGSPTLQGYNPESVSKAYDKMIRGNYSIKDIEDTGEFINTNRMPESQRKKLGIPSNVYIGANDDGSGTIKVFTKEQLENGIQDGQVFEYLNGRLGTIHELGEARFYSKNGVFTIK